MRILKILTFLALAASASYAADAPKTSPKSQASLVKEVAGVEALNKILESSGNRLLVFDLYADWCGPCKLLSPLLEEIAREEKDKATVYKIHVDRNPQIAGALGVTGIPYVLFVKGKTAVHAMTGLQPKAAYVRAIRQFADAAADSVSTDMPDGESVEGTRVIRFTTATAPKAIHVYRGETVKLVIEKVDFPYSIHIPEYKISQAGNPGAPLEVTFKAEKVGVFPIFCNGQCPTGDGMQFGRIVVLQYEGSADVKFSELSAADFKKMVETAKPVILDVRTPNEYSQGHLENSILIPLQQLEQRAGELEAYKDRDILVYCRSGNRSVVAAQILIRKGFKKVHHLRRGIVDWQKSGGKMVKRK